MIEKLMNIQAAKLVNIALVKRTAAKTYVQFKMLSYNKTDE